MNLRAKLVVLVFTALGLVGMSSLGASARIVCNEDGDCWHSPETYAYPPAAGIIIHPELAVEGRRASRVEGA
ncbi:MAG TPA: hypothetical protein VF886_16800 [Roseiarcus sp.]